MDARTQANPAAPPPATAERLLDGAFFRTARKEHKCWNCPYPIKPGQRYVEYLGESPGYQNGKRYHLPLCAREAGLIGTGDFYTGDEVRR